MSEEKKMTKQELDQACAEIRDTMPGLWWALYTGCKEQGFTDDQSLKLVIGFIQSKQT